MNLLDNESLILRIGDLKLEDTYYTFGEHKKINEFEYCPIPKIIGISDFFVRGDARYGVEIKNDTKSLFLAYGANRATSNAQNIAVGFYSKKFFHFIIEHFDDIYSKEPELVARSILKINDLQNISSITRKNIISRFDVNTSTKQNLVFFKHWLELVQQFETAFSSEQLSQLSKIRAKRLEKK